MVTYEAEKYTVTLLVTRDDGFKEYSNALYVESDIAEALLVAKELAARAEDMRDSDEWRDWWRDEQ